MEDRRTRGTNFFQYRVESIVFSSTVENHGIFIENIEYSRVFGCMVKSVVDIKQQRRPGWVGAGCLLGCQKFV